MTPIGIFDSGYGGLTILQKLQERLPQYDYLYLGDNARAPYGSRSFDVVYDFTRQAVMKLFELGCHLVILGCNTASAKALRSIQQNDLTAPLPAGSPLLIDSAGTPFDTAGIPFVTDNSPLRIDSDGTAATASVTLLSQGRRVLGVIRPTVEQIGHITQSRHVGYVATEGTVRSMSYELEVAKFFPDVKVSGQACPLWAAIVEAGEAGSEGADYFVKKRIMQLLDKDPDIDTIILGCTHYPLLMSSLRKAVPDGIRIIPQGDLVVESLADYFRRHPDMDARCTKGGVTRFLTTENPDRFKECARIFLNHDVEVGHVDL